jgi:hypothetical protein
MVEDNICHRILWCTVTRCILALLSCVYVAEGTSTKTRKAETKQHTLLTKPTAWWHCSVPFRLFPFSHNSVELEEGMAVPSSSGSGHQPSSQVLQVNSSWTISLSLQGVQIQQQLTSPFLITCIHQTHWVIVCIRSLKTPTDRMR